MGRLLRIIYTALFYIAVPFILLRLALRSRWARAYAKRWNERFAYFPTPQFSTNSIWIHAVSMGEFMAATALIKAVKRQYPDYPVVVTTTTPTGSERVQTLLGSSVFHVYAPYDLPSANKRFLNKIKPAIAIIMETELWPNMLGELAARTIPVFIANARLSEKSAKGYKRILPLAELMCRNISVIGAQTASDQQHFLQIGANPNIIKVLGNLKFDQKIPQSASEIGDQLKKQWGVSRPVWIAASTHEGEEDIIFAAHRAILKKIPEALLMLVPRHPERFNRVFNLAQKTNFRVARRSQGDVDMDTNIFIGDSMGELMSFYAASDLAFVGGSLVAVGGHNLLEPAALGIATLTGPYIFNMLDVTQSMVQCGATRFVHTADELATSVVKLLQDAPHRHHMGDVAQKMVLANRGAVAKHCQVIGELLHSFPKQLSQQKQRAYESSGI